MTVNRLGVVDGLQALPLCVYDSPHASQIVPHEIAEIIFGRGLEDASAGEVGAFELQPARGASVYQRTQVFVAVSGSVLHTDLCASAKCLYRAATDPMRRPSSTKFR